MDTDPGRREGEAATDRKTTRRKRGGSVSIAEALADLSPETLGALCKRMTGMSLEDWAEMQQQNRVRDFRKGKIDAARPLTHDRMMEWITLYGFDQDDFVCCQTPISVVKMWDLDFEAPKCNTSGRVVTKNVVRYRLKNGVLPNRI